MSNIVTLNALTHLQGGSKKYPPKILQIFQKRHGAIT